MTRWRPPREQSAPYITAEGYKALQNEYTLLWQRRVEVTAAVTAAAAEGDRSENAEYIYRKKELRGIDSRIGYLQRRLPSLTIVNHVADAEKVFFSAWVKLESDDGQHRVHRIVGADEIGQNHYISLDSPVAKSLMQKQIGDEVILNRAQIEERLEIIGIGYGLQNPF